MIDLKGVIAARLRQARIDADLTQNELADLIDVQRTTYEHYETERNMIPLENLLRVCGVLDRPIHYFLNIGTLEVSPDELELIIEFRSVSEPFRHHVLLRARQWSAEYARLEQELADRPEKIGFKDFYKSFLKLNKRERIDVIRRLLYSIFDLDE